MRILGINDFHGHVESRTSGTVPVAAPIGGTAQVVPAGGAPYLSTVVNQLRNEVGNSVFVGAGDLIGASPLTSGVYHDEPAIEALSEMGMDVAGIGERELDEGPEELMRMQFGTCHPIEGCFPLADDPFSGATFDYLAANVRVSGTANTILPPYEIKSYGGIPVAFIGMTLEGTPDLITSSLGNGNLSFDDEADTANRLVRKLRDDRGIHAFVLLLHEGASPSAPNGFQEINACNGVDAGQAVVDVANRLDDDVDIIVSGHTHQAYVCPDVDGKLLTSAFSQGRVVTKIDATLDGESGDFESHTATNLIVRNDVAVAGSCTAPACGTYAATVPAAPDVAAVVEKYRIASAGPASVVIGRIAGDLNRNLVPGTGGVTGSAVWGESRLGDVLADAQLAAAPDNLDGSPTIAFVHPSGIRQNLIAAQISGTSPPEQSGEVTFEEAFSVQPFSNNVVTTTCTGAQIDTILEQQFGNVTTGVARTPVVLQVSNGFSYTYDMNQPVGSRVDSNSITLNATPVIASSEYVVATNSFLVSGGEGLSGFGQCDSAIVGGSDLEALLDYLEPTLSGAPLAVPTGQRFAAILVS